MKRWYRRTSSAQRIFLFLLAALVAIYPLGLVPNEQHIWQVVYAVPLLTLIFLSLSGNKEPSH